MQNKGTYLIDAFNKTNGQTVIDMSVKDVCVETDFYTLKHLQGDAKYKIEDFLSERIEGQYPMVYKILVQEKKKFITPEERMHILYTTLSMYFRTPKALNEFVTFISKLVRQAKSNSDIKTINFLGYNVSVKNKSFEKIKKEIKENKRIDFIKAQLEILNQFVGFRALDGFVVIELVGDQEFVTSDNPVEIRNSFGTRFNLFDTKNSIYIPLDPKHALFIAPRQEKGIINEVFYQRDNFFQHVILNYCVHENAERWVIGTKSGISKFLKDQKEYAESAQDNNNISTKFKNKIKLMKTLEILLKQGISNDNKELIQFLKSLREHELYNESVEFQDICKQMKEIGLKI